MDLVSSNNLQYALDESLGTSSSFAFVSLVAVVVSTVVVVKVAIESYEIIDSCCCCC